MPPAHAELPSAFLSKLHKLANGNYELPSGIIIDKNGFLVIKNKTQIHTLHFASIQGANGTVSDGPSCQKIGGTWDGSVKTCTVTSLVVNSPNTLTISGNIMLAYNNLDVSGVLNITQGSSTGPYNVCTPDSCTSSFTIEKNGLVNNSGIMYDSESNLIIYGTLNNLGSISTGKGSIFGEPNSTIDNQGQIDIQESSFDNSGIFNNHKTISNSDGDIQNNDGASFINDGNVTQTFNGFFINNGTVTNNVSSKITNTEDPNSEIIINLKTISNFGNITNEMFNYIDNNGAINNQCGTIFNSGTFSGNAINNISCKQTQMNDNIASYGATTNSATPIQAEFVTNSSSLSGKLINIILVDLKKIGSPSGTIQIGIFNSDLSVKQLFGTKSASSLSSSLTQYSFSLPTSQKYEIQPGDRIGIKFTGGTSSNYVDIGTDQTNSFNGSNSLLTFYRSSWMTFPGKDLTMTLKLDSTTLSISSMTTGLTAKPGNSQIFLSWTTPSNNGGSSITGYKIERASPPNAEFSTLVANTGTTATTYTDSGLTANNTYGYRLSAINSEGSGIVSNIASATLTSSSGPPSSQVLMNDTILSYGATTNSANSLQTEYASASSVLVGKPIDTMIVDLKKVGSPTGTIQIGIFNTDLSVKQLFGSKDASSLTTSQLHYSFSLPTNQTYTIQSGDRIGVKYTGGSSSSYVDVGTDQTNAFDGTNSYLMKFTTSWETYTGKDLTMTLTSNSSPGNPVPPSPPTALTASATSSSQISLSWTSPSNNGGSPITGYKIERESPVGAGFSVLVANTNSVATTFVNNGLAADTVYNYRVSAINSAGTGNSSNTASAKTQSGVVSPPTTIMNDTVLSYGATTNSANQLQTEFASSTSSLVGKSIDTIKVNLKKVGSPTGTIQIGIFNTDRSVKQLFGTKDASTLTSSQILYSFSLPTNQTYQIQSGDRIGVKYTGGSSSSYVDVGTDQTNSFDGTNSYLMKYTTTWETYTGKDLTMALTLH